MINITLDNYGPKHVSMKKIHIPTLQKKLTQLGLTIEKKNPLTFWCC